MNTTSYPHISLQSSRAIFPSSVMSQTLYAQTVYATREKASLEWNRGLCCVPRVLFKIQLDSLDLLVDYEVETSYGTIRGSKCDSVDRIPHYK